MAYESKDGSGALFKNDKGDNPARPDYRGDVMVGGVTYELSAWIKPMRNDPEKRFMSLSAKPKTGQPAPLRAGSGPAPRQQQRQQPAPLTPSPGGSGFDDFDEPPF